MAQAALDVKAEDLILLDLRKLSYSFEFFLICSAGSDRRILTVMEKIEESLSEKGMKPQHREGRPEGGWMLLDFGFVVAHVFAPEARQFYQLERLWSDAPRLHVNGRRRSS